MKWTPRHTKLLTALLTALAAFVIALVATCETDATTLHGVVAAQLDDNDGQPVVGFAAALSPRVAIWATYSWNATDQDTQLRGALTAKLTSTLTIAWLLGPQITNLEADPDLETTTTYILTSTGIALSWSPGQNWALFVAYDRLIGTDRVPHNHATLGVAIPIAVF
jgi:hypothetical protein